MKNVITLLAMLSTATLSHANILTGPVVNPANGHRYYLLEQDTWTNSEAFAQTLGGHLVTINDAAENAFVLKTFGPTALGLNTTPPGLVSLWIGLNDADIEGQLVWASDMPVTYTNWVPGQPQNSRPDEDFTGMLVTDTDGFGDAGQWHDIVADFRFNDVTFGVVEVIPEPASLALLGLGGLALLRRNKNLKERN